MRKLACAILLLALFMQEDELLIICRIQLDRVHREMKKALEDRETSFEHISLSLEEFNQSGYNGKEIVLHGKIYDIGSINFTGNRVDLLAVNDTKEEVIMDQISNTGDQGNHSHRNMPVKAIQLLGLLYDFPLSNNASSILTYGRNFSRLNNYAIDSRCPEIDSPPPRLG